MSDSVTGKKTGIGVTPVKIFDRNTPRANTGTQLVADSNNGDNLYVGFSSDILAGSGDMSSGFPVTSNGLLVPTRLPDELWVVADGSGDNSLYYMVV